MTSHKNLKLFNKVYDKTYSDILKFIIIKCHNVNDANDIIQDVYFEFWKILNKKEIDEKNIKSFLIGIAINKIRKHFNIVQKIKTISIFNEKDKYDDIAGNIDIEKIIINKNEWELVWNYIKNKKNQNIPKIFYLHYVLNLSIKEISKELGVSESYVKNNIYRTLKELSSLFRKGDN